MKNASRIGAVPFLPWLAPLPHSPGSSSPSGPNAGNATGSLSDAYDRRRARRSFNLAIHGLDGPLRFRLKRAVYATRPSLPRRPSNTRRMAPTPVASSVGMTLSITPEIVSGFRAKPS